MSIIDELDSEHGPHSPREVKEINIEFLDNDAKPKIKTRRSKI